MEKDKQEKLLIDIKLDNTKIKLCSYLSSNSEEVLYKLETNSDYEAIFEDIPFAEAIVRIIDLMAGEASTMLQDNDPYPYNKSQVYSMALMISQADHQKLVQNIKDAHDRDVELMRKTIAKNNTAS